MEDLYLKENSFNIPNVDANVESSAKEPKVVDAEALENNEDVVSQKITVTTEKTETPVKGNSDDTLKTIDNKSDKNPRVVDKNTVSSDGYVTSSAGVTNVDGNLISDETVKIPEEKQDVGPDVETSLGQQEMEEDDEPSPNQEDVIVEPNTEVHVHEDQSKSDESDGAGNQVETDTADLEMEESPEIP
jgi:hypothetical protein